jgi:hypothetical protein
MNDFFNGFEGDICKQFKMWPERQRADVERILLEETNAKQAKLEAEALAQFQAKQADEERMREEQAKATGKPAAKAPPPKKAAAKEEKP